LTRLNGLCFLVGPAFAAVGPAIGPAVTTIGAATEASAAEFNDAIHWRLDVGLVVGLVSLVL
jgi:hypothetical protein